MSKGVTVEVSNVFKGGKDTLKQDYNNKWVELINQLEKSKGFSKE